VLVPGTEPIPVVGAAGHIPGRVAFEVRGTGSRALVVGDAVHCPAELLHADVVFAGDLDAVAALRARLRAAAGFRSGRPAG
jgi:glyoxylase-like metal-dependent hydrolase (beta-lactamase superfamily II)